MSTQALRAEHDAVLSSLSTRVSTQHFAHGAVSLFASLVLGGTAARLWLDFGAEHPEWAYVSAGLACVAITYSLGRLFFGARTYGQERTQLHRLLELRKTLGVDAPASLTQGS